MSAGPGVAEVTRTSRALLAMAAVAVAFAAADTYVVVLALMYVFSQRLFRVPYEWRRLALVVLTAATGQADERHDADSDAGQRPQEPSTGGGHRRRARCRRHRVGSLD